MAEWTPISRIGYAAAALRDHASSRDDRGRDMRWQVVNIDTVGVECTADETSGCWRLHGLSDRT